VKGLLFIPDALAAAGMEVVEVHPLAGADNLLLLIAIRTMRPVRHMTRSCLRE
jgi:hypothetical protein